MSFKNFIKPGLDKSDERKLIGMLDQIKELHTSLTAKYELRADLMQLVDKRQGAARVVKDEVETLRKEINELVNTKNNLNVEIEKLFLLKGKVEHLELLIEQKISDGRTLPEAIEYLLDESNYENWLQRSNQIDEFFNNLFLPTKENNKIKSQLIEEMYEKSEELNKFFFKEDESVQIDGVSTTRDFRLRRNYKQIEDYYDLLFSPHHDKDGNELPSISQKIKKQTSDLEVFHNKIFGTNDGEKKSLSTALDERLNQLKEIEQEALRIINLSSTAGLAGGFFEKAKEAKMNKYWSLGVFAFSLILLAAFNYFSIEWDDLDSISIKSIIVRALLNLPLIWLATVANINLNKYSRLEQEYGHKEALAKSYEKYRDEISKLPTIDESKHEVANELHAELIKLNLEAFKKNPTDDIDKAKANLLIDKLLPTNDTEKKTD